MAAALAMGASIVPACGGAPPPGKGAQASVALTAPAGSLVTGTVTWAVLAANGDVLSSGTLDANDPTALVSVLVSIPAGIGERISVTATLQDGEVCKGISDPLDVLAGEQVPVDVGVTCNAADAANGLGSVLISTDLTPGDSCPALTGWSSSVAPGAVATTGQVDFWVSVSDADPGDHLSYAWAAALGNFSDTVSPKTTYFCQQTGAESVSVTIADDHQPQACVSSVRFPPIVCP